MGFNSVTLYNQSTPTFMHVANVLGGESKSFNGD